MRPLRPGYSFGLARRAGTLGLVVRERGGAGRRLLLSSGHVLNERPDGRPYPLYQPAGSDARGPDAPVARAVAFLQPDPRRPSHAEAALAEPLSPGEVDPRHPLGPLRGAASRVALGERLEKVGRTTGRVEGEVVALDWRGSVRLHGRPWPFARQVIVASRGAGPVSRPGDSGGVWVSRDREAVALAFAGLEGGRLSIGSPMPAVLAGLGVDIDPEAMA